MKIIHRLTLHADGSIQGQLRDLGIEVGTGLVTFEIDEANVLWPIIQENFENWGGPFDYVSTRFTAQERMQADYLSFEPTWHHGYPMPEDDFEYKKVCYDLSSYCNKCGIEKIQVNPLRMKAEPKWGKKHILQLNWIFDEYFTLPDVWESTFKPFGIDCKPVIHHRSGKELETVVQLDVAKTTNSSLQLTDEHRYSVCDQCGRKKYLPIVRGPYPLFQQQPSDHMLKTQEYFGSGASAWNAIMVSSTLFRQIKQHKLKGVDFSPCSDVMA